MKIFKGIIHILAWISYVAIAVYAIVCLPIIFGHKPLVVLSGSMAPHIKEGSIIYFHKVPKNEIKEGNIISFKVSDKIVSHRVYKVDEKGFTTKGDATNTIDPVVVTYDQVLGKVDNLVLPYIGFYIKTVNTHYYLVVIVVLILILEFASGRIANKDNDELVEEAEVQEQTKEDAKEEVPNEPEVPQAIADEPIANEPQEEKQFKTETFDVTEINKAKEKEYKTEVFDLGEIKEANEKVEPSNKEEDEEIEIL